jgi:predicted  nucleic acid-binding Zn-ribbon protein
MRRVLSFVVPLLLLAGCGGNEELIAQKRATIRKIDSEYKRLNQELVDKQKSSAPIKLKLIPAQRDWMRAKQSGDSDEVAAAKARLDQVQAEAAEATSQETALQDRISELRRRKQRLEDEILRLGGRP